MDKGTLRPKYYKMPNGNDLWSAFDKGLIPLQAKIGFELGSVIKYVIRYREKNGITDLHKADEYLEKMINSVVSNPNYKQFNPMNNVLSDLENEVFSKDRIISHYIVSIVENVILYMYQPVEFNYLLSAQNCLQRLIKLEEKQK